MKLVTYRLSGAEHVGALTADGKGVLPLPAADMNTLIETMTPADLRSAAAAAERGGAVPLSDVELLAPIPRPRQDVVCLGMNYRDHAEESARYSADAFTKNSTAAVYFSKRVSEAGKPDGVIPRHAGLTDRLDYEAELAVVLGKAARDVKAADAADYIFGYTVLNDVSARDLQTAISSGTSARVWKASRPWAPCWSPPTRSPIPRRWRSPAGSTASCGRSPIPLC